MNKWTMWRKVRHCRQMEKVRDTYHIQCLVHKAMVNGALGSRCRVLRAIVVLVAHSLNGWWQRELFLSVLLSLFLANSSESGTVGGVCSVTTIGCLDGSAVCRNVLLLDSPVGWTCTRQRQGDFGDRLSIGIHLLRTVGPGGRQGLMLQRRLHPLGVVDVVETEVAVVGTWCCACVGMVMVVVLTFGSRLNEVGTLGLGLGLILLALVLLVWRFRRRDNRNQNAQDGMEDGDDKGHDRVQKSQNPSAWTLRCGKVPAWRHFYNLFLSFFAHRLLCSSCCHFSCLGASSWQVPVRVWQN